MNRTSLKKKKKEKKKNKEVAKNRWISLMDRA
jgi:hypothetical protein